MAVLILACSSAYAQQNTTVTPSVTPPGPMLQVVQDDATVSRLDVELGSVRLMTHSGRYTFAYLPFLAPLPGTAFRPTLEMPNAFALTGTTIPQKPHSRQTAVIQNR